MLAGFGIWDPGKEIYGAFEGHCSLLRSQGPATVEAKSLYGGFSSTTPEERFLSISLGGEE